MQWDDSPQAGFTSGKPWLAVNSNYPSINVAQQESASDSILNYFRNMIRLRKQHLTLVYGTFELLDVDHTQLFVYKRQLAEQTLLIVLNFSDQPASLQESIDLSNSKILISNYEVAAAEQHYRPYEAVIYELDHNQGI
jgi:oligo-1,6-glucosidase